MKTSIKSVCLTLAMGLVLVPTLAKAGLVVTIENPGVQASTVSGVTTETFNSLSSGGYTTYNSAIGTYTGPGNGFAVVDPNQYGGADKTRYMSVGAQSGQTEATLTLSAPQAYFGFLWLAGDGQNSVEFRNNGALIASFSTSFLFPYVANTGGPFGHGHYGNPNTDENQGEPYAYLNFFATGGTVFDQVIFRNQSTGSGFETDNHSVRSTPVDPPYPGTVVTTLAAVPEPTTIASAGMAGVVAAFIGWRRRKQSA